VITKPKQKSIDLKYNIYISEYFKWKKEKRKIILTNEKRIERK
jgi:hypothetical protein